MKKKNSTIKNRKGVALLITLFAITVMTFLAVEIGYNTHVELRVGSSQLDRLRAYYLAKAGVQISLLRIMAYKTIANRFGQTLGANKSDLDLIWNFPFSWPPIVPSDVAEIDKAQIKDTVKKSSIDGSFFMTINSEGGKININDLDSPSPGLQKAVFTELVQMISNRINADDDWGRDHRNIKPEEIVNNIADWIDPDDQSRNGGAENVYYENTDPPIKPPNRSMKTIEELHMVAGVTDDIYNILAPNLTVYGEKGINVNYAGKDVLKSIDRQVTDDIAKSIMERRSDPNLGPFKNEQDFYGFLQSAPQNVYMANFNNNPKVPLYYDTVYNFRIKSTGIFGKAQREIVAIVYDFDKVKSQLSALMALASPTPTATPGTQTQGGVAPVPTPTPTPTPAAASGGSNLPPQIVLWQEY